MNQTPFPLRDLVSHKLKDPLIRTYAVLQHLSIKINKPRIPPPSEPGKRRLQIVRLRSGHGRDANDFDAGHVERVGSELGSFLVAPQVEYRGHAELLGELVFTECGDVVRFG